MTKQEIENKLLQKVKDQYAKEKHPDCLDWDRFISDQPIYKREEIYDEIAELYHATKLAEVKGECFTKEEILNYLEMWDRDEIWSKGIAEDFNAKANEFAAAKCNEMFVEQELDLKERRMFTEEQVKEAISKAFDAGDSHAETGGRSADLKETTDFIINQIKQKQ